MTANLLTPACQQPSVCVAVTQAEGPKGSSQITLPNPFGSQPAEIVLEVSAAAFVCTATTMPGLGWVASERQTLKIYRAKQARAKAKLRKQRLRTGGRAGEEVLELKAPKLFGLPVATSPHL